MWKNIVERGRPQMSIWRMRIVCYKKTYTQCVTLIAFRYNNGCTNVSQCYVIRIQSWLVCNGSPSNYWQYIPYKHTTYEAVPDSSHFYTLEPTYQWRREGPRKPHGAGVPWVSGPTHTYTLLTFVMCYFGPLSVLLIKGSILRIITGVTSLIIMGGGRQTVIWSTAVYSTFKRYYSLTSLG